MYMLKTNTAVRIAVGPLVDPTDGKTAETGLTVTGMTCDILQMDNDNTAVNRTSFSPTASGGDNDMIHVSSDAVGMYDMELTASQLNFLGNARLVFYDVDGFLVHWIDIQVVSAAYFDWIFGSTIPNVNVTQISGDGTAADNLESYCDGGANMPVDAVKISGDATAADNCELMFDGTGYAGGSTKLGVNVTAIEGADPTDTIRDSVVDDATRIDASAVNGLDAKINTIDDFLDTEVAAILAAVDTEVAAILADTNELQTDLVNGGRLDLLIDAIKAKTDNLPAAPADDTSIDSQLAAIAGYLDTEVAAILAAVDTEVAAIKAKTDNLPASPANEATLTTIHGHIDDIVADTNELQTDLVNGGRLDLLIDGIKAKTDGLNFTGTDVKATLDSETVVLADASSDAIIADAVWNAATGSYGSAGTYGETIEGMGLTAAGIADAVWDETLADHIGAGKTGAALNAAGSAGDPWSTAIPGSYGAGTAGKILGDNINATISSRASQTSLDTVDDFLDTEIAAILADTNELQTDLVNGGRLDLLIDAIKAKTDNLPAAPADDTSIDSQLATIAGYLDTEIAAIKAKTDNLPASPAAVGSAMTLTADYDAAKTAASQTSVNTIDDFLDTEIAAILADTNELQTDLVNGGRLDLLIDAIKAKTDNIPASPAATGDIPSAASIADAVWDEASTGHVDAGKAGAQLWTDIDAILEDTGTTLDTLVKDIPTNAELTAALASADDAVLTAIDALPTAAEIQAEMEENGASLLDTIRDTLGTAGAGLTAVPWNAAWDAEVQSECTDALNAYDPPTKSELDSAVSPLATTAELNKVPKSDGTSSWNATALAAINAEVDSALNTAIPGSPTADSINERIAALDNHITADYTSTEKSAIDLLDDADGGLGDVHTVANAIKAKTDNLPTDPADQSAVEAAITAATSPLATASALNTVDDFLDTEIAAIKAVTDKLDTTLVLDGAVYDFTAAALAAGPGGGSAPTVVQIRQEMDSNSTQLAAIVADTAELQTNQGNWLTATGFATASALSAVATSLARALGLMQENYYLDSAVYSDSKLTSCRLRTYSDPASVGTSSDVLATYTVTATWSGDDLETYEVVKT